LVDDDGLEETTPGNADSSRDPVELEEDGPKGLVIHGTPAVASNTPPHDYDEASDIATALEVATTLGVDTEGSEQRIACKRGMLSLRVVWGKVARFCMLPVNVGFDSLVAEVSRRFGLSLGSPLPQLCWREAGEMFKLSSQACWEECLQRRGLVAQPGRLQLCVDSDQPPPLPVQTRAPVRRPFQTTSRPDLFTWRTSDKAPSRQTFTSGGGRREFCARSPSGAREPTARRELITRSPSVFVDPVVVGADEARKQLHAAAVKVQRLFRDKWVRRQSQEGIAAESEDPQHRLSSLLHAALPKAKASTTSFSRGIFTAEHRNASDAPSQLLGQTFETLPAAVDARRTLQSRNARRPSSRCRGFMGTDSRDTRRSLSPKAKSPPYQTMRPFDLGTGSRLHVSGNGRFAPRK